MQAPARIILADRLGRASLGLDKLTESFDKAKLQPDQCHMDSKMNRSNIGIRHFLYQSHTLPRAPA